jgi:hypothetical protein
MSRSFKANGISFALLSLVLSLACVASSVLPRTSTPAQPPAATSDLMPNIEIVQRAINEDRPELLRSLIGDEGVTASGFATEFNYKGNNNADEIITAFSDALDRSEPVCAGFLPNAGSLPDKAILVYRDLALDWSRFDLSKSNADGMTIQLFKLSEGWRFVVMTPFDFDSHSEITGSFQDCPFD